MSILPNNQPLTEIPIKWTLVAFWDEDVGIWRPIGKSPWDVRTVERLETRGLVRVDRNHFEKYLRCFRFKAQ